MNNGLLDNSNLELSMVRVINECLTAPEDIHTVSIATGYWDIPGLALVANSLRRFLERGEKNCLRLLLGCDPKVMAYQLNENKYKGKDYPNDYIRTDINELDFKEEYKQAVGLLLDYCNRPDKLEIRLYGCEKGRDQEFLHSKCYIFLGKSCAYGIIGSSNFTYKGLCENAELNYLEVNIHAVSAPASVIENQKSHMMWFNEKWENSREWTREFLEQVLEPSPIAGEVKRGWLHPAKVEEFTPYELYIKLLQTKFGSVVDQSLSRQLKSYMPEGMMQLEYQMEAVKRCLGIMHEHGGFMLGDVVGLGKTVVGGLIIRHFLSAADDDERERRVLIVTPPTIKNAWKQMMETLDNGEEKICQLIDYVTTGSISALGDAAEVVESVEDVDDLDEGEFGEDLNTNARYGLIIIDESHRFRNKNTKMYEALDGLIGKIFSDTGVCPYVGLLSATLQNNHPGDIQNQLYLFERTPKNSTLNKACGGDLDAFFADVKKRYGEVIKNVDKGKGAITEEDRKKTDDLSREIRESILVDILERRTRTDVKKYYADDLRRQGIEFPEIVGPQTLEYEMDEDMAKLFSDTVDVINDKVDVEDNADRHLHYYRYRAIEYFKDDDVKRKYRGKGNRDVSHISEQLAYMIKILLVKRLESSATAFRTTLENLRRYTRNMMEMWENDTIFVCPQIDVNDELDIKKKSENRHHAVTFEECLDDIRRKIENLTEKGKNENGRNAEYRRADFNEEYIKLLKHDHDLIDDLCTRWGIESEDPKTDAFKDSIDKLFDAERNAEGKLVIFSEAVDTTNMLKRILTKKKRRVLWITAKNREEKEEEIKANFDANYPVEKQRNDYDVVITTEVLAEGVNLHRANVILNYDTPWNSTRLMQRIGRVNRIGSKAKNVYVYNFMPSAEGDAQIQLVRKAHTKLQTFHNLFGEDSKIFSGAEVVRGSGYVKMSDEEESPMQKYIAELKAYKMAHPERYEQIAEAKDGWTMGVEDTGERASRAYMLVKAGGSMAIPILWKNGSAKTTSIVEMIEGVHVDEQTKKTALPSEWEQIEKAAKVAYAQYIEGRIAKAPKQKKVKELQTQAKGLIREWVNTHKDIEPLLNSVRDVVDGCNRDVINKVVKLGAKMNEGSTLIGIDKTELKQLLEAELQHVVEFIEKNNTKGKPTIAMAAWFSAQNE